MVEQITDYERRRRKFYLEKQAATFVNGDRVYVIDNTCEHPFAIGECLFVDHVSCFALYCSNYFMTKVGYVNLSDVSREKPKEKI